MTKLFIAYRYQDAGAMAQHIVNAMLPIFGADDIRTTYHNAPPGADIRHVTAQWVRESGVLVVLIGTAWSRDPQLRYPHDTVRIAIETALRQQTPILPVLLHGAVMPAMHEMPESIQPLAYKGIISVRAEPDFRQDMARLVDSIRQLVPAQQPQNYGQAPQQGVYNTPQGAYAPPGQQSYNNNMPVQSGQPAMSGQPAGNGQQSSSGSGVKIPGLKVASFTGKGIGGIMWTLIRLPSQGIFWIFSTIFQQMLRSTISMFMTLTFMGLSAGVIIYFVINFIQSGGDLSQTFNAIQSQIRSGFLNIFRGGI